MSDVKRYDMSGFGGGLVESEEGAWYHMDEYAKLEAEAQALREEVAAANDRADTLEHRMMGMITRHFAEAWRNRDTTKELDGYLSAGIAELERERDAALEQVAALRGGRWHSYRFAKGEKAPVTLETAQAAWERDQELIFEQKETISKQVQTINALRQKVESMRARVVVVVPEHRVLPNYTDHPLLYCEMTGFNKCLDELARLNGKAVSEGLLRRLSDLFPADMGDDGSGRAGWLPHVRETVAELRALLDGAPT